jgi:cytochrome c biogenesis protein CcmG/thiol:disulfide interchange protein DsbE
VAEASGRRPVRAILLVAILAVALLALLLLLVPLGGTDSPRVGGHPLLDEPAPDMELLTIDGDRVRLSDLRGQPVIVNFWATWCEPCRVEFPLMATAYAEHADDGLEILGVLHDDFADGARRFAADMGATWPIIEDPDDVAYEDFIVPGLPTSYFVDAEGIVRAFSLGGFTETGLDAQLATILPNASPVAVS